MLVVRFKGVNDREVRPKRSTDGTCLSNGRRFPSRKTTNSTHTDLIGCRADDEDGALLGRSPRSPISRRRPTRYPSGGRGSVLVPFTSEFVRKSTSRLAGSSLPSSTAFCPTRLNTAHAQIATVNPFSSRSGLLGKDRPHPAQPNCDQGASAGIEQIVGAHTRWTGLIEKSLLKPCRCNKDRRSARPGGLTRPLTFFAGSSPGRRSGARRQVQDGPRTPVSRGRRHQPVQFANFFKQHETLLGYLAGRVRRCKSAAQAAP